MDLKVFVWTAAATAVSGGLAACAGSLNDPAEFGSGSSTMDSSSNGGSSSADAGLLACAVDVPTAIFKQTCGVVSCHNPASPAEGLDLESPNVASRLVDVPENEDPSLGLFLIDSANPPQSVILTKLQAATVPYGSQMPFGGTPLTSQQVACVGAWINSVIAAADAGPDG